MPTMRLMPEEVDSLRRPLMALGFSLEGAQEAIQNDDKTLTLAYLEIAREQAQKLEEVESKMSEPIPV